MLLGVSARQALRPPVAAARTVQPRRLKPAARRRGSVLVLVMTLLSILFVVGVAFLATMNFESERVAAEAQHRRTELGAEVLVDDVGGVIRTGMMADADQPFAGNDAGGSLTGFAQLPGWHNAYSPVEPYAKPDGRVVWPWMVDLSSVNESQKICLGTAPPYVGETCTSSAECGAWSCEEVYICQEGSRSGGICFPDFDCPGGYCDVANFGGPVCISTDSGVAGRSCIGELSCPAGTCVRAGFGGARWRGAEIDASWEVGAEAFEDLPGSSTPTRTWYQGRVFSTCRGGPRAGEACRDGTDCCDLSGACGTCAAIRLICLGGSRNGETCLGPADCAGGICTGEPVITVDADGDGIVDSIEVEAEKLGFSEEQIEQISTVVNGASDASGKVYVGLRAVPHGGMVNLNDAHPTLIENVLNISSVFDDPEPADGRPLVRSARDQVFYAAQQEEPVLRRRNLFPARTMPPTRLQGDPLVSEADRLSDPYGGADMPAQLFAPKNNFFESVFEGDHRYWPTRPGEEFPDGNGEIWPVRMEPFTSFGYDGLQNQYDRRHLVTTVSHDALLSRGGQTIVKGEPHDIRDLMMEVNGNYDGDCAVLPFELPDYPQDIINNTKPNEEDSICQCPDLKACTFDPRKGRLQLSLAWLDQRIEQWIYEVFTGTSDGINIALQRKRLIYDYFYMMLRNAAGPEWDDVPCTLNSQCDFPGLPANEQPDRCSGDLNKPGLCVDKVLNLPRHEARATRTAAMLTANLLDYMDDRVCVGGELDGAPCGGNPDCPGNNAFCGPPNAPTRVAIRNFDFAGGECVPFPPTAGRTATHEGAYCRTDDDCVDPNDDSLSTICSNKDPYFEIHSCAGGIHDGFICDPNDPNPCQLPGVCVSTKGREINIASQPKFVRRYEYVYGMEQQPFITEVATVATGTPRNVTSRAVELFNPSDQAFDASSGYMLVEVDASGNSSPPIPITSTLGAGRFTALVDDRATFDNIRSISLVDGQVTELTSTSFQFINGWTVYLVKRSQYPDPTSSTGFVDIDVVLDAFPIAGNVLGRDQTNPPPAGWPTDGTGAEIANVVVSAQRVVPKGGDWLAPIPEQVEQPATDAGVSASSLDTLGGYNDFAGAAARAASIHPVEMRFPNTGSFTRSIPEMYESLGWSTALQSGDPDFYTVAFPTTGSLLMLLRHANHALGDLQMPTNGGVFAAATPVTLGPRLANTGYLNDSTIVTNPTNGSLVATINARNQIDNGRMPVFDVEVNGSDGNRYAANHRAPWQSTPGRPGGVEYLPWGQFVYDYFTVLPLSNRGPYRPDPFNADASYGLPGSQPRVDLRGLRVHGRIDLNAAPWTVLAGLPFIPLEQVPLDYRDRFRAILFGSSANPNVVDGIAQTLGFLYLSNPPDPSFSPLAQAIVAYREARDGSPFVNTATTGDYRADGVGRGYMNVDPAFRRGTGFLTVGELANIRHTGADSAQYRFDTGVVGGTATNSNYIDAIALLATLGDWATVRSDVFTLYGVIRGEADPAVGADANDPEEGELQRIEDVDARALRFQETIDRLPTFTGERLPSRIGDRTLAKFKDVQSD